MDYRKRFSQKLFGRGLDVGPLHRPLLRHKGMTRVDSVDRLTTEEARHHYPELVDQKFTTPDFIDDAETLASVDNETYDFVWSSHNLEHMKNPLKALENWIRILKPGGLLYLIVPDHRKIFDRDRPRTTLEHVIEDYADPNDKRDFQHCLEYSELVDKLKGDEILKHAQAIRDGGYSIHFHCWVAEDIDEMLKWFSSYVEPIRILEGPLVYPDDDHEIHTLIKKI